MCLGLEDVASRLKELYNSCESLPECRQLINKYADKLTINNDFDRVCTEFDLHETTYTSDFCNSNKIKLQDCIVTECAMV